MKIKMNNLRTLIEYYLDIVSENKKTIISNKRIIGLLINEPEHEDLIAIREKYGMVKNKEDRESERPPIAVSDEAVIKIVEYYKFKYNK